MQIETRALVVVADGEKALFLENRGSAQHPQLKVLHKETQENPPNRDQKADRQHGFSAPSNVPDNAPEADFHQLEKDRFAHWLGMLLNENLKRTGAPSVVIAAPPKTLGELRDELRDDVRAMVAAEIPKDYTNHSAAKIGEFLARAEVPAGVPRTSGHE